MTTLTKRRLLQNDEITKRRLLQKQPLYCQLWLPIVHKLDAQIRNVEETVYLPLKRV